MRLALLIAALAVCTAAGMAISGGRIARALQTTKFEGSEHKRVVDDVFAKFEQISNSKFNKKLNALLAAENVVEKASATLANPDTSGKTTWFPFVSKPKSNSQFYYSLGQTVALAGDYYGRFFDFSPFCEVAAMLIDALRPALLSPCFPFVDGHSGCRGY